jgi:hypothetical protein
LISNFQTPVNYPEESIKHSENSDADELPRRMHTAFRNSDAGELPRRIHRTFRNSDAGELPRRTHTTKCNISENPALLLSLDGTFMYTVQNNVEYFNENYKISRISQRDFIFDLYQDIVNGKI